MRALSSGKFDYLCRLGVTVQYNQEETRVSVELSLERAIIIMDSDQNKRRRLNAHPKEEASPFSITTLLRVSRSPLLDLDIIDSSLGLVTMQSVSRE